MFDYGPVGAFTSGTDVSKGSEDTLQFEKPLDRTQL
jgi:hypothetical protein